MLKDHTLPNGVIVEVLSKRTAKIRGQLMELKELEARKRTKIYLRTNSHWRSLVIPNDLLNNDDVINSLLKHESERLLKKSSQ